ncbi:MAG: hypothetical protein LBI34_02415 [Puniceicoccales bacterium]|jgi:hypothetical protein|nr:hypothetical protein [Puniceicoccales bacterium]
MKKTLACAALVGAFGMNELPALDLSAVSLKTKVGYESEHVVRGRKEGQENIQLGVTLATNIGGGELRFGVDSIQELGDRNSGGTFCSRSSLQPMVAFIFGALDTVQAEAGYMAHIYPNLNNAIASGEGQVKDNTHEVYGEIRFDALCSPSARLSYNSTNEEFAFTANGEISLPLGAALRLQGNATLGYLYCRRPYGVKFTELNDKDYIFFKAVGSVVACFNENVDVVFSVSYAGNAAPRDGWVNSVFGGGHKNCVWLGGAILIGF